MKADWMEYVAETYNGATKVVGRRKNRKQPRT